ncbi:hypothetical protein V496_02805 [Pseudogymnoascus sp. VKM F-4515 (FW-2607)]|nr:hypothetical protein V496_02805 [Pseudogymnoascus sp. VKM F-4515 (FW-2607)]KFZ00457.1 hypothetical protein V498_00081 [Pseudogymnoascus sp. VKM F-4517 (FW-2822)]
MGATRRSENRDHSLSKKHRPPSHVLVSITTPAALIPLFYTLAGLHNDRVQFAVQLRTPLAASGTESSEGGGNV